ncbi:MAG: HD domain-containing protein, partial [Coxiellaceae bacterium]|nr:HD domain-containing protein [Coxiellaceae bacterium]
MTELSTLSKTWLEAAKQSSDHINIEQLAHACAFVENLNEKTPTLLSNSVLEQGLNMATELLALNADNDTLVTAIAYPAIYYGQVSRETIEKQLGKNIYKLLVNAKQIEAVQPLLDTASTKKIDNLRKMILAIVDDVRIVLIKLAECLVILKYLRQHDAPERKAIAQQTMDIYAPLANRLGIGQFKWQLE